MRLLTPVTLAAAIAGCSGLSREERAAIDARAAASMWPLADGFWWEYDDTASPGGARMVRVEGLRGITYEDFRGEDGARGEQRQAWTVGGLWSREVSVVQEPHAIMIVEQRPLGYGMAPTRVPVYEFRWDRGAWDIRSMDG